MAVASAGPAHYGKPMIVLLFGPPGSGKGTQGERLSALQGWQHIAAGDLLRAEVQSGSDLGRRVSGYMDSGELVPDDLIVELVMPHIVAAQQAGGVIIDGFPRTMRQALASRVIAAAEGFQTNAVILLDAPRQELIRRIMARAQEEGRSDDTPEVVENRLQVYDDATHPLIDYFRERGLLHVIDGTGTEDEVAADILTALGLAPESASKTANAAELRP